MSTVLLPYCMYFADLSTDSPLQKGDDKRHIQNILYIDITHFDRHHDSSRAEGENVTRRVLLWAV